ncbi:hypothetical protein HDV00_008173 [Rhizophlyctis rosea]|nr:hypothetical protein HDV00_008173 [Rhizophlyctis rosea]
MQSLSKLLDYAPPVIQKAVEQLIARYNSNPSDLILKLLALSLPTAYILNLLKWYLTSPLAALPGPFIYLIHPYPMLIHLLRGTTHTRVIELHKIYGPTYRVNRTSIATNDPAIARDVLITRDLRKSPLYENINFDGQQNLFNTRNKELHHRLRRFLSPAFSIKYLYGLEPLMLKCIQQQHAKLEKGIAASADKTTVANIYEEAHYTALDIIGETAFGRSFGMLKGDQSTLPTYIGLQLRYVAATNLVPFIRKLPLSMNRQAHMRQNYIQTFMQNIINERREQREKIAQGLESASDVRNDILQLCVMGKDEESGVGLTDLEVASHTILFLIAGTDTSSNTMTFTLLRLLQNPHTLQKLQAELDALPLDPSTNLLTHTTLKDCTYLESCIRESMRLDPVAVNIPRIAEEDMVLGNKLFVNKGTVIFVSNGAMHVDESVWDAPLEYRPERWEGKRGDLYDSFYPFSAGTRNCIGKNFAWMELRLFIGNLLRKFNIAIIEGLDQSLETENYITVALKTHKYLIKVSPRQ